jgi:hypothetical protein
VKVVDEDMRTECRLSCDEDFIKHLGGNHSKKTADSAYGIEAACAD